MPATDATAKGRVVNITFHGIGAPCRGLAPGEDQVWTTEDRFVEILDLVGGRDDVSISFDDGNQSDVSYALPILVSRGVRATFFVIAGRLGVPGYLTEQDVARLAESEMRIGNHGMSHVPWRRLSDDSFDTELRVARDTLREISKQPVTEAACPFGAYDRRTLRALRTFGYTRVYTSDDGWAPRDAWLQPRNSVGPGIHGDPTAFAASHTRTSALRAVRQAKLAVKRWR